MITAVVAISGILSLVVFSVGSLCLMYIAGFTDLHDKVREWIMHKILW